MHEENCFVTLTYNDDHLPADRCVRKEVVSGWIKRIRSALSPKRIRYLYVGEYGEQTLRPHYHASLFGVCGHSIVRRGTDIKTFAEIADAAWRDDEGASLGFIQIAEFNELTAQYISGYVLKKLTDLQDDRLIGRTPEFAEPSRRPGLGYPAIPVLAKALKASGVIRSPSDVPRQLKVGKRRIPVGRYLRQKLLEYMGFSDEEIRLAKQEVTFEKSLELSALFKAALASGEALSLKETYVKSVHQRILQTEARAKIWSKRGSI